MAKTSRFNGRQLTTKEFLSIANANAKAASQTLHNIFGFDFNAPMHCGLIDGAFTFNSICNFCEIPRDERPQWVFALLIRQKKACDPRGEMFHVAGYSGYGDVELHYPIWHYHPTNARDADLLRGFYKLKDFEEWRRRDDSETLFVLQDKKLRKPTADSLVLDDNDADFARYTITKVCGNHFVAKPIDYINNRGTVEYWEESRKASNILDKSGYLVRPGQRSLRKRLAEFKAEKAKIGFLVFAADFPKIAENFRMKLDSLRLDAAALLKNRQDAGSVRRIGRIISGNDGLAHAFDCLDSLETLMQDKDNPRIGDCLLVKAQIEKAIEFVSKTIVDFDTWETH